MASGGKLNQLNFLCQITWLKDRQEVDTASDQRIRILDNGGTLQIVNIGVGDAGRYTCRAQNQAGAVDKHYNLEVLGMTWFVSLCSWLFWECIT